MKINRWTAVFILWMPFTVGEEVAKDVTNTATSLLGRMATVQKKLRPLEKEFMKVIRAGKHDEAEELCKRMVAAAPFAPGGHYNLACVLAIKGDKEKALKHLDDAVERGFNNVLHLKQDPDLFSLHDELRFVALVEKASEKKSDHEYVSEPFEVTEQTAWVQGSNVGLHPELRIPYARYHFGKLPPERVVSGIGGEVEKLLTQWFSEGTAAGNWGDLYDNRDNDHSNISRKLFPQMTWIEYSDAAKDANLHWGLMGTVIQSGVVLGNASVAQTSGPYWRSMPRLAHSNQRSADFLYWQYTHNKLYLYPCHVDYPRNPKELEEKTRHDVYPMNSPYVVSSQGSSGSDRVFLRALAATMAAFRPEVKKHLVENGTLSPTLQYILRRTSKAVETDDDYLTGVAHPTVFSGSNVDMTKMVTLAHEMKLDTLPPVVRLNVSEETEPINGRDYFAAAGRTEKLFDTPCAIARVFRGHQKTRRMIVNAESSYDPSGNPLSFRWCVLRAAEGSVQIRPLNDAGSIAEIVVTYQPRRPISDGSALESSRVDIGVFARNKHHYSAPAFITWYSLDHEERVYDESGRIRSITYRGATEKGAYTDPVVALPKSWRDEYHYDGNDKFTGWTRHRKELKQEFAPDGQLVTERDANGKIVSTKPVTYAIKPRAGNRSPIIEQVE